MGTGGAVTQTADGNTPQAVSVHHAEATVDGTAVRVRAEALRRARSF
jgi:hypothetical protein